MKSFRARLLIGFGLVLALATGGFGTLAYFSAARDNQVDLDAMLSAKAFALSRIIEYKVPRLLPYMEQGLELDRHNCFLQLFNARGELISKSSNLVQPVPLSESAMRVARDRRGALLEDHVDARGRPVRVATYARGEFRDGRKDVQFFAQVGAPLDVRQAQMRNLLITLVLGGSIFLLVALGAANFFVNSWLRSLAAVEDTARRISVQNLAKQRVFVPTGDAELARLARSFNDLLDQLETAHGTQQRFVADASHELRTPLTILRGEMEVALRKPRNADEYRDVLQSNREEIERMSRLVENLLALASTDAGEDQASRETVELVALCGDITEQLTPAADAKRIRLSVQAKAAVYAVGEPHALRRVVFNLVENGIRYSPQDESVTVCITDGRDEVTLEVIDTGQGIPAEHLPHIFERFYRVDKARSREFGGAGLGLSIVKAVVLAHGGRVEAQSQLGHGTRFTVHLPRANERAAGKP